VLKDSFQEFVEGLEVEDLDAVCIRFGEITKRLNLSFYGLSSDSESNGFIVGSIGRHTAISGFSDLDMLFVLPKEKKKQYDDYKGNGQSKLLQDVKKEIKKRYPKTIVRGDGQVVVVSFESINKIIEVCPVFERTDGAFDYPDSNNGGAWKKTDPFPEIEESESLIAETNSHFKYVSGMVRSWKNNSGFKFGGLLIDTLVYNFLDQYPSYKECKFEDYLQLTKDLFYYLKTRKKDQSYWFALGSSQKVYNKKGTFVTKAENVFEQIKDLTEESDGIYQNLQSIFGSKFPVPEEISEAFSLRKSVFASAVNTEEFIEDKFRLDIHYALRIDCKVRQAGFREKLLRVMLRDKTPLLTQKKLEFFIIENEFERLSRDMDIPIERLDFEVYWKVLNRGEEAIKRKCIRGQIVKDQGKHRKMESTDFRGDHIVECFIVYKDICIARDRLVVPIRINI
jgi:hypothetical protein